MGNIYIIGFMGTGKSTLGRELARRLRKEFIDLDEFIESTSGKRIADIFVAAGESFFRTLERRALAEKAATDNAVIACGGGIVIDQDNVALMRRTGFVMRLTASAEEILRRTAQQNGRPLLDADDRKARVETLMAQREKLYRCAHVTLDTTGLTPEQAVERMVKLVSGA